jgi:sarcosine oxidase subunit beta
MPRERAEAVIVGAGCIGASIAYHLARRGMTDVVVLERERFAGAGSTAKAAGGIRQQFSTEVNVRISQLAVELFRRLPEELGGPAVYSPVGYLFLLSRPEHWEAFQRQAERQRALGVPARAISPREAKEIVPQLEISDLLGATFCPTDGLGSPHELTQSYAESARRLGVRFEFVRAASGLIMEGGRVRGVRTSRGDVDAPLVVNAAGPWAAEVAAWAGVELPVLPYRRQVFTTRPLDFVNDRLPMIVDFASGVYMHRESGGMLMGLADLEQPPGFDESLDWDFAERVVEPAVHRVPALERAELASGWAGLYETTPDHNAVLGWAPGAEGLLLANGFSGHGFMHSPAVGLLLAELVVDGRTRIDLSPLRLERFQQHEALVEANVI